jgi:hypothetical protein
MKQGAVKTKIQEKERELNALKSVPCEAVEAARESL